MMQSAGVNYKPTKNIEFFGGIGIKAIGGEGQSTNKNSKRSGIDGSAFITVGTQINLF